MLYIIKLQSHIGVLNSSPILFYSLANISDIRTQLIPASLPQILSYRTYDIFNWAVIHQISKVNDNFYFYN